MRYLTFSLICLLALSTSAQFFPPYRATFYDTGSRGYYFTSLQGTMGAGSRTNVILDSLARPVYVLPSNTCDFKLFPNGLISFAIGNRHVLMDSTFTVVDTLSCKNGIVNDMHDLQILPNGHFLLLGYETVTMDLSAYHYFNNNGTPGDTNAMVKCGVIQEQDQNHQVVFEWHCRDHYSFDDVDSTQMTGPFSIDWTHCNAIEQDTDGNLLLSVRHFNEITKINRSDSSIMWRLGGKRNQFTFTNNLRKFARQHDIRRIANGHLTLFDNGAPAPPLLHAAGASEYAIDESAKTATRAWNYITDSTSYSMSQGSFQRLSNGNAVIDYGNLSNDTVTFNVVDANRNKILETTFLVTPTGYRTYNYPALPWQLHRPQITCLQNGGQYYLLADSGYASYAWNTGVTSRAIAVTHPDSFYVLVPVTNGFLASEYFFVADTSSPCGSINSLVSEEKQNPSSLLALYPNPAIAGDIVTLKAADNSALGKISIYDVSGRLMMKTEPAKDREVSFPTDNLRSGLYFIEVSNSQNQITAVKKMSLAE